MLLGHGRGLTMLRKIAADSLTCKVKEVRPVTPDLYSLAFDVDEPFEFRAGQYLTFLIPELAAYEGSFTRNYSIATPPEKRPLEVCFEIVGPGSTYLHELRPGGAFHASGPFGKFVYRPAAGRHFCYVATGSGIGPFRSMVFSRVFQESPPVSATCVLGVEDEQQIPYRKELEAFADKKSHHFLPVLVNPKSKSWEGQRGTVTDCLRRFGETFPLLESSDLSLNGIEGYPWTRTDFFLCGEGQMIRDVTDWLVSRGVPKYSILREVYFDTRDQRLEADEARRVAG